MAPRPQRTLGIQKSRRIFGWRCFDICFWIGAQRLYRPLFEIVSRGITSHENWSCAKPLTSSLANYGFHGPISSKLLCIPEGDAKVVSLARIGNYEVRMFESSRSGSAAAPQFSMELFDHDAQSPVDSCICYSLDEGVAAFQDFISR